MISANPQRIVEDFERLPSRESRFPADVRCIQPDAVRLGGRCRLAAGVVLDARRGPIVLGDGVEVGANAVILGPAVVLSETRIHPLTLVEASTIGPMCRMGGEIRECVIQGYSNKQHSGFLGHSYLGEWVNLGAETTTSDLKNNYGPVRVPIDGRPVDSGERFVGSYVADHTKSAIGSRFSTGSVFGVSCLLYARGFLPKYVPSFTWLGGENAETYALDRAIETARTVMARRNVDLTPAREALLRHVYESTTEEREAFAASA